jgi:transposase
MAHCPLQLIWPGGVAAGEIEEAFLSHPFGELLASRPGIGPRTGARILAETGDGSAFANGSKLAACAGLAPVTRQSGTSLAAETRRRCDVILAMLRTDQSYQPARPAPGLPRAA